jgi:hypothetical protein
VQDATTGMGASFGRARTTVESHAEPSICCESASGTAQGDTGSHHATADTRPSSWTALMCWVRSALRRIWSGSVDRSELTIWKSVSGGARSTEGFAVGRWAPHVSGTLGPMDPWWRMAALNNAEWCDVVCRSHGAQTWFDDDAWTSPTRTPPYYLDAVTLVPDLPFPTAAHAFSVLDSYIFGSPCKRRVCHSSPEETAELAQEILARAPADESSHLTELTIEHILKPGYDYGNEFEFGLDLILDGLGRYRGARTTRAARSRRSV